MATSSSEPNTTDISSLFHSSLSSLSDSLSCGCSTGSCYPLPLHSSSLSISSSSSSSSSDIDLTCLNESKWIEIMCDGDALFSSRIQACDLLFKASSDLCIEYVTKLCTSFSVQPVNMLKSFLLSIVTDSCLPCEFKYQIIQHIYDQDKSIAYQGFISLAQHMSSVNLSVQCEILKYCMETTEYSILLQPILNTMVCCSSIDCEFRYKFLRSLCHRDRFQLCFVVDTHLHFIRYSSTYTRFRILASQYLLSHAPSKEIQSEIETLCQSFALDTQLDYDLRADAADTLLRLGTSEESQTVGQSVIMSLGRIAGGRFTVYTNRQNVHEEQVSKSVEEFLKYLSSLPFLSQTSTVSISEIQTEIESYYRSHEKECSEYKSNHHPSSSSSSSSKISNWERLQSSLFRIAIDQALYLGSYTLSSLFIKLWTLLKTSTQSDLLQQRMVEELIDMSNTCSSGHLSRLINVFSGIQVIGNQEFNLNIGWKKQIESNLIARLNKRIKDLPDESQRDTLLSELCSSSPLIEKPSLKLFFRTHLNSIRDELFREFVDGGYLNADIFETYIRESILFFEQG